jgi:DeoR/GlpR family transcriptional regulator of sugar metabolism
MTRHSGIIEQLQQQGFQSVLELAERFNVSTATIRRDLEKLEQMEMVQRTHGGAYPVREADAPSLLMESLHHREKVAIGRAMAERVLEGQTVLLDGGSTTLEVARHLKDERLTVVTNDLRVGNEIAKKRNAHLVMIGGELLPNAFALWGPSAVQQIEHLRVDVAIFGADTVNEDGIFNNNSYELELKRKMRSIANSAFFVADSSKFGREALFRVLEMNGFTAGITDDLLDPIRASKFPVPIISVHPGR